VYRQAYNIKDFIAHSLPPKVKFLRFLS